jgi:Fe-S cluster assembly scaffold protein SufB
MDDEALRKEITEKVQRDFESQLREFRRLKNNAEEELDSASERWRLERRKLKAEIDQLEEKLGSKTGRTAAAGWEEERERLTAEISRLEACLAENSAVVDALRREYDARIEELVHQNERLKQSESAAGPSVSGAEVSILAATEVRLVSEIDNTPIDAEMRRVEAAIGAIETLLQHPNTTASMVARKKTERAELEAYLRGLNFQLVRSKGA